MAKLQLNYFLLGVCALLIASFAHAATPTLTLQGRITKADGSAFTGTTQFRVQILSPVEQCVLYDETQTKDLTGAEGLFSLSLNDGASGSVRNDSNSWSFQQVLSNKSSFSVSSTYCQSGFGAVVYTPGASDERKVLVQFKDSTMSTWDSMPVATLSHSAMAVDSVQVGGFAASNLLRFAESDGTLVNVSPLNNAQYTELVALVSGSSSAYVKSGNTGAVLPSVTTAPSSAPSAGQIWLNSTTGNLQYSTGSSILSLGTSGGSVTSVATGAGLTGGPITTSGTIALAAVGTAGTGTKLTYDTYGRVTGAAALAESDLPTISTAGKVSGSAITSGTIGGTTVLNTSGDLTTTGTLTAATTTATHIKGRDVQVFDSGTNAVTIQTPATLAAPYTLTLPGTAGTSGYVLSTNGSGTLSWIAAATGSVTSVTATAPLASSGGATPNLTIAKATASQDGYLAQTDFATFNGKQSTTLQDSYLWVGNASNVATGVAVSGDVSLANTGAMTVGGVKGVDVSASPTLTGQVLRYNGTTWTPNFVAMSDLRSTITGAQAVTSCGAGQTLTYTSVTDNLSCTTIAIADSQLTYASKAANLVLSSPDGSAGAPTFRSLSPADLPSAYVNGGNSFGAAASLGTNDANDLSLKTNNTTRLTVASSGKVGVGTTSPNAALDVVGAISASSSLTASGVTSQTNTSAVYSPTSSSLTTPTGAKVFASNSNSSANGLFAGFTAGVTNTSAVNQRAFFGVVSTAGAGSFTPTIVIGQTVTDASSYTERMRINPSGYVGIGTTNPGALLDVSGAIRIGGTGSETCDSTHYVGGIRYAAGVVEYCNGAAWSSVGSTAITALTGDVTASGSGSVAATVASVGGSTAANVHAAEVLANAATSNNTPSTIMMRNASGVVSVSKVSQSQAVFRDGASNNVTLEAAATSASYGLKLPAAAPAASQVLQSDVSGNLSWFTLPTSLAPTGAAGGDLSGNYPNPTVATVGASAAADIHAAELLANAATSVSTANAIVKRDGSGNFVANIATVNGVALTNASSVVNLVNPAGAAYTLTLPTGTGSSGDLLTTNGSGALSWTAAPVSSQWTTLAPGINYMGGRVGIGTTSPANLLDVGASGVAGQLMNFGTGVINQSNYIGTNARAFFGYNGATGDAVLQGSAGKGLELNVNNATFGSGTAMKIDYTGRVGVATTAPASLMHLASTNAVNFGAGQGNQGGILMGLGIPAGDPIIGLTIAHGGLSASSTLGFDFSLIGTNTYYDTTTDSLKRYSTSGGFKDAIAMTISSDTNRGGGNRLSIFAGSQADPTERMSITTAGNVGIGTTSPSSPLHVMGDIRSSTGYVISGYGSFSYVSGHGVQHTAGAGVPISFGNGAASEYMRIDTSTGNVGIGTTSPSAKLSVVGDILADATGSSTTTPRVLGVQQGSGQASRWYFGDASNAIQNAYNSRMQVGAYWGLELYGNRQNASGLGFATGTATDVGVNVIGSRTNSVPLAVTGASSQASNLQEWRTNTGTALSVVTSTGSVGIGTTSPSVKLQVAGPIVSTPTALATGVAVDLSTSNTFTLASVGGTSGSAVTIALTNPAHGGVYTIVLTDTVSHTYDFSGCTAKYWKPASALTTTGTRSIFTLTTINTGTSTYDCYISWATGYQ